MHTSKENLNARPTRKIGTNFGLLTGFFKGLSQEIIYFEGLNTFRIIGTVECWDSFMKHVFKDDTF